MSTFRKTIIGFAAGAARWWQSGQAQALDEVSFGTNWLAEAEHGGFYQAVADGTYEKYGLKVTIVQGGPRPPTRRCCWPTRSNSTWRAICSASFSAVEQDVPVVEVAAIFQKDPQILMAHPEFAGDGLRRPRQAADDLHRRRTSSSTGFQWMKSAYPGFKDEQMQALQFQPRRRSSPTRSPPSRATSPPSPIRSREGRRLRAEGFLWPTPASTRLSTMIEAMAGLRRRQSRHRPALRRCLDHRLVQLPLRRQQGRQRPDQEGQSGHDRRPDRLLDRAR